jgi:cytochrome b pre-mRNA-processing protein 3
MILLRFRKPARDSIFATLYGTIVTQARSPLFYRGYGVPDTVAGRLDMIVLHLVLFLRRLTHEPAIAQSLGQEVFDLFCQDMDDNFREMGVGDLAVPKEMRRVGEAYYGRAKAYEDALSAGDAVLVEALARNIFGKSSPGARRLTAYMREAVQRLAAQSDFARGKLHFPDPATIAEPQLQESGRP